MNILEAFGSHYVPSFFRMKVGTSDDLTDMRSMPYRTFSLFFHEYVHFLQDISTIYGLMNLSTITYYIQDVASRVGKDTNSQFEIPQELFSRAEDYGFENFERMPLYKGALINPMRKDIEIDSYLKVPYEKDGEFVTDQIVITYKDNKSEEIDTFFFGGNHICEGMAYLCSKKVNNVCV